MESVLSQRSSDLYEEKKKARVRHLLDTYQTFHRRMISKKSFKKINKTRKKVETILTRILDSFVSLRN